MIRRPSHLPTCCSAWARLRRWRKASGQKESACPTCGFTHADFKKSGRFGCPACYDHFSDGLVSLLKSMHKGVRHVGKVPKRFKQLKKALDTSDRLKTLQAKLSKAIEHRGVRKGGRPA